MKITEVEEFLKRFRSDHVKLLQNNLVGIYLHGSLVMGCFNPKKSDIDLLLVAGEKLNDSIKKKLISSYETYDKELDNNLEVSVVTAESLENLEIRCPYELYYYTGEENDPVSGFSQGLVSDYMLVKEKGRVVYGQPIETLFPSIPKEVYIISLLKDVRWCVGNITRETTEIVCPVPVYSTLNPIRFYAYLTDGKIRSKKEGAEWGIQVLPKYRDILRTALAVYTGEKSEDEVSCKGLREYGLKIKELIEKKLQ